MGSILKLVAGDGHQFTAYQAEPAGSPRGVIVVIQEVFGVTPHIQRMCDGYAADGYRVIAPAIFDRIEPNLTFAPTEGDRQEAAKAYRGLDHEQIMLDIEAALNAAKALGPTAILGYCAGGDLAWEAAARYGCDAAVCYYGGGIAKMLDQAPACPVQLHNGTADPWIPAEDMDTIAAAKLPQMVVELYDGIGHAFNNDTLAHRYDEATAIASRHRTLAFLAQHIGV